MKKMLKYILIDALTSGEYKQGRGRLRDNDKFCCLGVISDLHCKLTGNGEWTSEYSYKTPMGLKHGILAPEVQEWSGILTSDGIYNNGHNRLMSDNDNGKTFEEIAEIIFENF